jgi:hypothetical protein
MTPPVTDVKPFAWAGIAMEIPAAWETGALGDGYALLEYQFRPVMELKTARVRGRFSFRRHLKQLARSARTPLPTPLQQIPPPAGWPEFPPEARVASFGWQNDRQMGTGLLYYCRHCRRATLLQFYGRDTAAAAARVLASFDDHGTRPGPTVAVYDIQAVLPDDYRLTRFEFNAGRFELAFRHAKAVVTLWRWSPADVMLKRTGGHLAPIVRDNRLLPAVDIAACGRPVDQGMEWRWQNSSWRRRLRALWKPPPPPPVNALRIWHRPDANRLLGVRAEGADGWDVFERICRSYGIL